MADAAKLHADWHDLLRDAGAEKEAGERLFTELLQAYREPQRFYHTLDHVGAVLWMVEALLGEGRNWTALRFAAWFHDAVYDPQAADNEERSAAWAERALAELSVARPVRERVRSLILLTKTHRAEPDDADGPILLDADLAILGAPAAEYAAYAGAIRREYAWVPEDAYRAGRARVLCGFLERERIYQTPAMSAAREAQARRNLDDELRELDTPPGRSEV